MKGYNETLKRIEPSKIICYSEPFPEMRGNIIYVDYELSSWKYQKSNSNALSEDTTNVRIIHKTMVQPRGLNGLLRKGSGSAYGGKWKPKKEDDKRLLGKPGEIKETFDKNGERRLTKIGDDGRAVKERHFSDHKKPWKHTNPHDHIVNWEFPIKGVPNFEKPHINYYGDVPEFKNYFKEMKNIMPIIRTPESYEEDRFKTISEFKLCVLRGGEIEFEWKGKSYSITHPDGKINIGEGCYEKNGKYYNALSHTEYIPEDGDLWGDTADEILEYNVGGDRLRDVITQVKVWSRTI